MLLKLLRSSFPHAHVLKFGSCVSSSFLTKSHSIMTCQTQSPSFCLDVALMVVVVSCKCLGWRASPPLLPLQTTIRINKTSFFCHCWLFRVVFLSAAPSKILALLGVIDTKCMFWIWENSYLLAPVEDCVSNAAAVNCSNNIVKKRNDKGLGLHLHLHVSSASRLMAWPMDILEIVLEVINGQPLIGFVHEVDLSIICQMCQCEFLAFDSMIDFHVLWFFWVRFCGDHHFDSHSLRFNNVTFCVSFIWEVKSKGRITLWVPKLERMNVIS